MTRPACLDRHDIFRASDPFHARSPYPPREGYLSVTQPRDDSVRVHAPARYTCHHQESSYTPYSLGSGRERLASYAVLVARSCLRLLFLALVGTRQPERLTSLLHRDLISNIHIFPVLPGGQLEPLVMFS